MTLKNHQTLQNIIYFFLLLGGILLFNTAARAATYTVTTTADSGAGSLRQAVADGNGNTSPDTITFAISAADPNCTAGGVCTITLTSGDLFINPTFSNTGALTITNPTGAANLIISGNNTSRVFNLTSVLDKN